MQIWYPPGAGGMWLNYFIWCSFFNTVIEGTHPHFEFTYLKSLDQSYSSLIKFSPHNKDYKTSDITFGDEFYYFNFYLNLIGKKVESNYYQAARTILDIRSLSPTFNITWSTLFVNRNVFCEKLSGLIGNDIILNYNTHRSIDQFISTLHGKKPLSKDFINSPAYYYWSCAVADIMNLDEGKCLEFTETMYRPIENFLL